MLPKLGLSQTIPTLNGSTNSHLSGEKGNQLYHYKQYVLYKLSAPYYGPFLGPAHDRNTNSITEILIPPHWIAYYRFSSRTWTGLWILLVFHGSSCWTVSMLQHQLFKTPLIISVLKLSNRSLFSKRLSFLVLTSTNQWTVLHWYSKLTQA